ncbi:ATP-binding protein [Methylobacterium radiotolerans]|jgi:hypothetical protein|uniref:ATP-binding protein n=1 Tax=Methylobacterium TaxID=407 RepID=UPI0005DBC1DE|nr:MULTISPECIES: ATP-binding protein [Methylobacterium]MBN6823029.1 ATP-binding protein [Methylobacterium organophilum]OXE42419.1 hypothetical protein CCS92_09020 [Methylobacterium radiotolerans]GAN51441.1 hypothetical protein ME121_5518 [Methylobacterium sp. ME121]
MSADMDGRKEAGIMPGPMVDDADAFFHSLRGRYSDAKLKVVERLDLVEAAYVACGRDKVLGEVFDTFLQRFVTTRDGRRKEADILFLTGPSGAGKSEAIGRVLRQHELLQTHQASFGPISPYVSIKLSGYTLPRIAAHDIIVAAGHPMKSDAGRGDLWNEMPAALKRRLVFLVHIDETQHLIKGEGTKNEISALANAIKGVSISSSWPVAFVLSGLPKIAALAKTDEQFERRAFWVDFPDVQMPAERKLVVRILRKLAEAGGLNIGSMGDTDMPERMARAARFRYARICQGVVAAIHVALRADPNATELRREHFALAYANQSRARGHNHMNPFLVDDWAKLPEGSFLGEPGDEER